MVADGGFKMLTRLPEDQAVGSLQVTPGPGDAGRTSMHPSAGIGFVARSMTHALLCEPLDGSVQISAVPTVLGLELHSRMTSLPVFASDCPRLQTGMRTMFDESLQPMPVVKSRAAQRVQRPASGTLVHPTHLPFVPPPSGVAQQ
jgi:hypothetical protein